MSGEQSLKLALADSNADSNLIIFPHNEIAVW
jgi:hypothetical protein